MTHKSPDPDAHHGRTPRASWISVYGIRVASPRPLVRVVRLRLRRMLRTDHSAITAGIGASGLLALLLALMLLPGSFGVAHALAAIGMLQVIAALHLSLSLQRQSPLPQPAAPSRTTPLELIAARDEALAADQAKDSRKNYRYTFIWRRGLMV